MAGEAGLEAIAVNARRLSGDARYLLDGGRYPTAMAVAILALEEAGKFYLRKWSVGTGARVPILTGRQGHQTKQQIMTAFMMAEVAIRATTEFVARLGKGDSDEIVTGFIRHLKRTQVDATADEEDKEKARNVEEKLVSHVADEIASSEGAQLRDLVWSGGVESAKHRGLYVDIGPDGSVSAGPQMAAVEEAAAWVARAEAIVVHLD